MPLVKAVTGSGGALSRAILRPSSSRFGSALRRGLATSASRRIAMKDGGRAVDDIDLAFDYPSEVQARYTTPGGAQRQAHLDKEMGYPDQRLLYAVTIGIGLAALYGAIRGWDEPTMYMRTESNLVPSGEPPSAVNFSPPSSSSSSSSSHHASKKHTPDSSSSSSSILPSSPIASSLTSGRSHARRTGTSGGGGSSSSSDHGIIANFDAGEDIAGIGSSVAAAASRAGEATRDYANAMVEPIVAEDDAATVVEPSHAGKGAAPGSRERERKVHLPDRKPTDSKLERFIGRGG